MNEYRNKNLIASHAWLMLSIRQSQTLSERIKAFSTIWLAIFTCIRNVKEYITKNLTELKVKSYCNECTSEDAWILMVMICDRIIMVLWNKQVQCWQNTKLVYVCDAAESQNLFLKPKERIFVKLFSSNAWFRNTSFNSIAANDPSSGSLGYSYPSTLHAINNHRVICHRNINSDIRSCIIM